MDPDPTAEPTGRPHLPGDPLARLAARKAMRLRFLHALYEAAEGSTTNLIPFEALGARLGLTIAQTWTVRSYLGREGLLTGATTNHISITHQGLKEVEAALVAPAVPTEHFPPAEHVIEIGTAEGVVIQQGNVDSTQDVELPAAKLDDARRLASELEARIRAAEVDGAEMRELLAEAATAAAQLRSRRPVLGAVRESVGTVRDLLDAAVASGRAATGILAALAAAQGLFALLK